MRGPAMPIAKIASSSAHEIAAEIARADITPPDQPVIRSAIIESAGVQVVVTICRWDGPLRMHPSQVAAIEALGQSAATSIPPPPPQPPSPAHELTPLQSRITSVLSRTSPRKAAWIAMKLDIEPGGSFRGVLADLVRFGVIRRDPGGSGYLLA